MKFRLPVQINPSELKINHNHGVAFIGSCFTENIAKKLTDLKFRTDINPMGIVYNPVSVGQQLTRLCHNRKFIPRDFFFEHGVWKSFHLHSRWAGTDINKLVQEVNTKVDASSLFLRNASVLFITLGTAVVFNHKESGQAVANCHKVQSDQFEKKLLTPEEIMDSLSATINLVKEINSSIHIVFTISPVRHLSDGEHLNNISKSSLFVALHRLQNQFPETFYFPAYEILLDELRDYRFFAGDMVHPSDKAVDYIFERFAETYFSTETQAVINQISQINKGVSHRPFFTQTEEYRNFRQLMIKKISALEETYPAIDFSAEKEKLIIA